MKVEVLKCFEFDNGEKDIVIARNKEEAVEHYKLIWNTKVVKK